MASELVVQPVKVPVLAKVIFSVIIFALSVGLVFFMSYVLLEGYTVGFWEYVWVALGGWLLTGAIYGITTLAENRSNR